jgi:hypothetical protein
MCNCCNCYICCICCKDFPGASGDLLACRWVFTIQCLLPHLRTAFEQRCFRLFDPLLLSRKPASTNQTGNFEQIRRLSNHLRLLAGKGVGGTALAGC